jgi:hypothetical protein
MLRRQDDRNREARAEGMFVLRPARARYLIGFIGLPQQFPGFAEV